MKMLVSHETNGCRVRVGHSAMAGKANKLAAEVNARRRRRAQCLAALMEG
jgi:hypothetical protein